MRPAVLALGVFGAIVGLFLFVTGYDMASMSVYMRAMELLRDQYVFGLALQISGGITTAIGLALVVFGAASKEKEPRRREASGRDQSAV